MAMNNTDALGNEIGKLFVGGLHQSTTNDDLKSYFCKFGEVEDAVVMIDNNTQRSRGFGYVKFIDSVSVDKVISSGPHVLNDKEIDPKQCNINMKGKNRRSLKIFVGGIAPEVNEDSVKEFFSQYGNVTDVNLMIDPTKQRHRGFAFVGFDDEEVVRQLIVQHYVTIAGKQVEIKAMEPPNSRRTVGGLTGPMNGGPGGLLATHPFMGNPAAFGGLNMSAAAAARGAPSHYRSGGYPHQAAASQSAATHRYMTSAAQQGNPHQQLITGFLAGAGAPGPHHAASGHNPADINSLSAALSAGLPASMAASLWGQHSLWSPEHAAAYNNQQANSGAGWGGSVSSSNTAPGSQGGAYNQNLLSDYLSAAANAAASYAASGNQQQLGGPPQHAQSATNGSLHPAHQHVPPAGTWGSWTNPNSMSHHGSGPGVGMGVQHGNPPGGLNGPQAYSFNSNIASLGAGNPAGGPAGGPGVPPEWQAINSLAAYSR